MKSPLATEPAPTDRMGLIRVLWGGIFVLLLLSAAGIGLGIRLHVPVETMNRQLVKALALAEPALLPSSHPGRCPTCRHPAVDLRFSPDLPFNPPSVDTLLMSKSFSRQ